jgi:general secretion pathway protein D
MYRFHLLGLLGVLLLSSCTQAPLAAQAAAPVAAMPSASTATAQNRISGLVTGASLPARPSASYGAPSALAAAAGPAVTPAAGGDISFNFADTDIKTVIGQILGDILHLNYTIDPSVTGTVTMRTSVPLTHAVMIPTLQTLLAQNNAVLVQSNGLYRVMPSSQTAAPAVTADGGLGGAMVLPLRHASATQLATMLQPYVAKGGAIIAAPDQNALIIQGDPTTRDALVGLVQAFDIDGLAGQSYELFPVADGNPQDFADAFKAALVKPGDNGDSGAMKVVPLQRISAVLVIARTQSDLNNAARIYAVINQVQRQTVRSWYAFYLRNSRANDAAYVLQQAFTPDQVTAQPTPAAAPAFSDISGGMNNSSGSADSSGAGGSASGGLGGTLGAADSSGANVAPAASTAAPSGTAGASALLGPLSASTSGGTASGIRIIPELQNNALLVYATRREYEEIEAMLAKIDIVPLEVRIDATIAEVDLNGALQYGTQFFFKSGDINAVLSNGTSSNLATNFPGFVLSGNGGDAAPLAISMLQSVTKVRVLSAPELMVLDGQAASLQVGNLVPYLTQTSQDTTTSNSPVINSIDYRETGVILRVTPHVGSDGLVTLDLDQEVSGVASTITTPGINSPTFTDRSVSSRVAIQDGQTVGLAGLISDNDSHGNQGIPYLKNVPLLGALFGSQNNSRSRQEMLVLITPHVIRGQQQALDLTADLEEQLPNAAMVPGVLQATPVGGSADPDAALRARLTQ